MSYIVYIIPLIFTLILLFNGVLRLFGTMNLEDYTKVYFHYIPTEREKKKWTSSQKLQGKLMLIFAGVNLLTEILLIPLTEKLLILYQQEHLESGMLFIYCISPSIVYMILVRVVQEIILWKKEKAHCS